MDTLLGFFDRGRESGGGFDAGVQLALERMLVDPDFLLRIERDPPGAAPGEPYRLSGVELASRLSFFLWGSIPDEPLLAAAERERVRQPDRRHRDHAGRPDGGGDGRPAGPAFLMRKAAAGG